MSTVIQEPEVTTGVAPILLQMRPVLDMTDDQFFDFCQINRDLRIERTAQGEIVVMSPAGGGAGKNEAKVLRQVANWAERDGTGTAFSPSTGYTLPNKATRAPDASWVSNARLNKLTEEEQESFLPLCPEFVIEIRSRTDRLRDLQAKMREYIDNGTQLGLLIDPKAKRVYLYQPNQPVQELEGCEKVSCEPVLPGFELVLKEIW